MASRALITKALRDDFVVVCPTSAEPLPAAVRARDLADVPIVLFEPGAHTRQLVDWWLLTHGVRVRPAMELGSVEAIKEMVAAGLGYSIVPAMALRQADRKRLQIRPSKPGLSRDLGIVVRHDKPMTRGMQVLTKLVLSSAANLGHGHGT